jgi:lysophospholipase L1-like esterase
VNSAVPKGTDIVILAPPVGNDFVQGEANTEANIGATIKKVQGRGAKVAYLSLERGAKGLAQQYGAPYCEFPRQPELTSEGIHYTAEGYRKMAQKVLPCVERLLK